MNCNGGGKQANCDEKSPEVPHLDSDSLSLGGDTNSINNTNTAPISNKRSSTVADCSKFQKKLKSMSSETNDCNEIITSSDLRRSTENNIDSQLQEEKDQYLRNELGTMEKEETVTEIIQRDESHPLQFWHCLDPLTELPEVSRITKLHIYDFDNTIFRSPSPNPDLLHEKTLEMLVAANKFSCGGWWANPLILKNVGEGWNIEKQRNWQGFWNEDVLDLMRLSNAEEDTLTVIMTGRRKEIFSEMLGELIASKKIRYDALILKQGEFSNTLSFKSQVIIDLLNHYINVKETVIYDDRRPQLNGFQKLLNEFTNKHRNDMVYHLVPVFMETYHLQPKRERELVEEMVNAHNEINNEELILKQSIYYTGYVLPVSERAKILKHIMQKLSPSLFSDKVLSFSKFHLDYIPISKNVVTKAVEDELEDHQTVSWEIIEIGRANDLFALRVVPKLNTKFFENKTFILPLASKLGRPVNKPLDDFNKINTWYAWEDTENSIFETELGRVMNFRVTHMKKRIRRNGATGSYSLYT
ncbi:hypothetical protein WICMUC_005118 [Wickerhamomyces mucosus]|uniref:Swiss Army Knife RNA repair protein HAD domain-containing protein n=1 Tax=Wickerhamomyces mucosus TaxID=1378264 RepID=A0A9P8T806_9ASCO|nr:hypothetical protein WICMUC_005118 [Wickerhamomyces mucosus]